MRCKLAFFTFVLVIAACSESHTFSLSLGSSYVLPLNLREDWESLPVLGGGIRCPRDNGSTTIGFAAFYGNLRSDSLNVAAHPVLCTEINLSYRVLQLPNSFSVYAAAALINWSVKQADDVSLGNISLIASWENEFGAALGVSAGFQPFRDIEVLIPLRCALYRIYQRKRGNTKTKSSQLLFLNLAISAPFVSPLFSNRLKPAIKIEAGPIHLLHGTREAFHPFGSVLGPAVSARVVVDVI